MANASTPSRLEQAIRCIDETNAQDPRVEPADGKSWPKELLYGRRMSAWLEHIEPEASDLLRIAARAQHIARWEIPRSEFPEGRAGYHRWRTKLYQFHAERAGEIVEKCGYTPAEVERVRALLLKKDFKSDPEGQTLEDVACLVFLEFYFTDFASDHDEAKLIRILRKTWEKMSPRAREIAAGISLPEPARALLEKALAG